jgi:lipopolysaccharide cholinephosphotransferase
MDKQLLWIVRELEKLNIYYWCDSGTLLGLIRDGKLIDGDNDIDLGILSNDINKMDELVNKIKSINCKIFIGTFKGDIFKYKFTMKKLGERRIDINVFRETNEYMWCPQPIPSKKLKTRKPYYYLLHFLQYRIVDRLGFIKNNDYSKFPRKHLRDFAYWVIEKKYFKKVKNLTIDGYKVKIPCNVEDYLTGRYGNWKIPNPDWNFQRDDGMLKKTFFC